MLVITLLLASSARSSARAAKKTVQTMKDTAISTATMTEKHFKLQVKSQVLNEYSSVEMGQHISKLYGSFRGDGEEETIACFKNAWDTGDFSKVNAEVNEARRRVAWHFTKIYKLYKVAVLKKGEIKELTTEEQVKDIMLGMVGKIDKPNRESGKEVYTFFRTLYPDKNDGSHKEEMAT